MGIPRSKKWESIGAHASLFDRLTDLDPHVSEEPVPFINYDKKQLIESVAREASDILNTRCKIPYKDYEDRAPSALTYGIPDLYGFFDQSYADVSRADGTIRLCQFMANALRIFEPRLDDVVVEMERYDQSNQTAHLSIHAKLKIGKVVEPISFPILVDQVEELGKDSK